jgi:hypothetical protein
MEKKKKWEDIKVQEQHRKIQDRNAILADQIRDLERKRFETRNLSEEEKGMLKEQWQAEMNRQKEQQLEELRINKELNNEIHLHNIEQKRIKKIEEDLVREKDTKMVTDIVMKEKMLDQLEREAK